MRHFVLNQSVMTERIDISVIVCTRNRAKDIASLLESLCGQSRLPDELIIVDASDNCDTKNLLKQKRDRLPFDGVYKSTAPGLTRQRNIGISISRGKYLFFFDDDVVLDSEYISVIEQTFAECRAKNIGGMTGRITNINQDLKLSDKIFKKIFFLSDFGKGKVKLSGFPSLKIDEKPAYVEILSGCNMVYTKEVSSQFRFDETLDSYSYMEDIDFSYRVGKKYLLYYQPKAKLGHYPTAYKTYDSRTLRKMMIQNHRYLFNKNQPRCLPYILSHWISIFGVLFYNLIIQRDMSAGLGIIEGLKEPIIC
jgi:glycosyltransferase involved in cell wall biosynthesis